ncbi:MAG: penicillin-binding protein 1A [Alphaproteobacteria bacterium]|nr:penicillin-binding protein 1A [Alphaproteobacteria bacterium]MBV9375653.1 penicillin-binding protein 1A [Alphaproteobacteria bacterium]
MVKIVRFLFVCAVMLAIAACGFVGITLWYFGRDLPDYQQLAHYQPPIMTRVQAGDGRLLAEYATERRIFVPIQAIPTPVINAFLSAEDKNFYNHHGVDPVSILRAAITDVSRFHANRRPVGASTITQQVAKNMLLSSEISIERKVKEILLATRIEAALPKERILELYLNEIYLGSGAYGVAAAALTYFNKSLDELTLGEAAFLAGLPKAPNRYSPARFPLTAKARRDWVLDRMVEDGAATHAEAAQAEAEPLEIHHRQEAEEVRAPYFAEEVRRELLARYGEKVLYGAGLSVRTSLDARLQAASDKALRTGLIAYEHSHGGWRGAIARIDPKGDWGTHLAAVPVPGVVTDVGWQLAMVVRSEPDGAAIGFANGASGRIPFSEMRWARPRHENGTFGPYPRGAADVVKPGDVVMVEPLNSAKGEASSSRAAGLYTLCQVPEVSGGLVAMDPHTGRVLAISGGFSFATSQFDRATQAKRQPGSSIKPFVYLTALDHGFTPSTLVVDGPISLPQGPGLPMWSPTNYTKRGQEVRWHGPTPLRVALELSLNAVTARVASIVGMEPIAETIERFGIMDHTPREYSMALGAGETTLLRHTAAYAMLVNGGKRITPTFVDRVQDRNGATIFRADQRQCRDCSDIEWAHQPVPDIPDTREQVADPGSAFQIVTMLQGVVERGTGKAVQAVGKPIAGKTGTTNDWRDAWFVGFTPDLAAGVYIGFDDPDSLGDDETGGHIAAPVFRDFMLAALKDAPPTAFRTPPGMRLYRVSAATGLPASAGQSAIYEAYKPGTEPGHNRNLGLQHAPSDDDEETPVASGREPETEPRPIPLRGAPSSGTGGLY